MRLARVHQVPRSYEYYDEMYFRMECCELHPIYSFERLRQHLFDKHNIKAINLDLETLEVFSAHKETK